MILEMTRPVQGGLRQTRKLETMSNNLANADTTGFKKDVVSFDKKFKALVNSDFSQGPVKLTDNPLDIALLDKGFFKVDTQEGIRYTRNGNFTLDKDNILVDQNGDSVLGQGGAIIINGTNISINEEGEIQVDGEFVDILDIITFNSFEKFKKDGENNYIYEGDTTDEQAPERVVLKQMALEGANVKVVDEMVRMIDYHRMYEIFQKSMLTFDEIDGKAINDVGTLR